MKKNSLLKAIVGAFLIFVILSWIIPVGYFYGKELITEGTAPVGLVDLVRYPIVVSVYSIFLLSALIVLLTGGFYAVLNKTGAYGKLVEGLAKKFKGKAFRFVIITVVVLALLSSLTGLTLPLFVLVPFFIAVLMSLGYKKFTAFLSTFGAILVGNMASTYGFNVNGYIKYFLNVNMHTTILYRIIFFVVVVGILLFAIYKLGEKDLVKKTVRKTTKKASKNEDVKVVEEEVIPLYDKVVDKKMSAVPMIVIAIMMLVISLVGMYNWSNGLGLKVFDNIYEAIISFEINGYPIFKNILGTVSPVGYWANYEFAVLIIVATLLIGWIYNIRFGELVETFIGGTKKMVKVAVYMIIANIIFLIINSNSSGLNMYATIVDFFLGLTNKFNIVTMSVAGLFGGLFYNDFPYALNVLYSFLSSVYSSALPLIGLVLQYTHGLVMLVVPTSVILVMGLTYLDIPYFEYLKKMWKYLLMFLAAIAVILVVAMLII